MPASWAVDTALSAGAASCAGGGVRARDSVRAGMGGSAWVEQSSGVWAGAG
jgi:hypothetical protein